MNSIPESAFPPLRQQILVLRIIVLAVVACAATFGGIAIAGNLGKPQLWAGKLEPMNLVLLAFGSAALLAGLIVPAIVFHHVAPLAAVSSELERKYGPEVAGVLKIQTRIQTATIAACALFESGAFANLVGYFLTVELLHLPLAGVLILAILARFPWPGACERTIETELRRSQEKLDFGQRV
jgi:hypothetical protein